MAVPFDVGSSRVIGAPVALIDGVMHGVNSGNGNDETEVGQFTIAKNGTLVYAAGGVVPGRKSTLTWVDRHGAAQPLTAAAQRGFNNPRLSPDGRRIAVALRREGTRDTDIWIHDIERGSTTRLTPDGGGYPVWSPDGARIVYAYGKNSAANLYVINADGSGKPERLTTSDVPQTPTSWSSGNNAIAFIQRPTPDTFGIYVLPMDGSSARTPSLFLESRDVMWFPELSPDGHWMAYVSVESGRSEVYAVPYPGPGAKVQISTAYGSEPIWTARGRELLFRAATPTTMPTMSVTIDGSTSPLRGRCAASALRIEERGIQSHRSRSRVGRRRRRAAAAAGQERGERRQAGDLAARRAELDRRTQTPRADTVASRHCARLRIAFHRGERGARRDFLLGSIRAST